MAQKIMPNICTNNNISYAVIDFDKIGGINFVSIIEKLTDELSISDREIKKLIVDYRKEDKNNIDSLSTISDRLVYSFLEQLNEFVDHGLVLIFDTIEKINESVFYQMEESFFLPFVPENRVVIVLAGIAPINWTEIEIREIVSSHLLKPFIIDDTIKQLNCNADQAKEIYSYSFGHPLTNEKLYRSNKNDYEEIIRDIWKLIIDHECLQSNLSVIEKLSFFRLFDAKIITDISMKCGVNLDLQQFKEKLLSSGIVYQDRGGLSIDQTLRKMIIHWYKNFDFQEYTSINSFAASSYKERCANFSSLREKYLVEEFYHNYLIKGNNRHFNDLIDSFIENISIYYETIDKDVIDEILKNIMDDKDLFCIFNTEEYNNLIRRVKNI